MSRRRLADTLEALNPGFAERMASRGAIEVAPDADATLDDTGGFIVADDGQWVVVQQGMNGDGGLARHEAIQCGRQHRCEPQDAEAGRLVEVTDPAGTCATDGVWRNPDWLFCRDGRWRPVEPGTFPLADGISGRMGLLRGYGNAIVPPLAAEFVTAFLESLPEGLR